MANVAPVQIGPIRLFGLTDQANPPVFGKARYYPVTMVAGAATVGTVVNATVYPNLQSGTLSHFAEIRASRNQGGETGQKMGFDQGLMLELVAIPEGSTLSDAKLTASFPATLSYITISDFPIIPFGPFTNAFNSVNWQYEQGAELTPVADDSWGIRFRVMRYVSAAMLRPGVTDPQT